MIDDGKGNVLGVSVDVVDYEAAVEKVIVAARSHLPFAVTALAVHGVMCAVGNSDLRARVNRLDLAVADGQPVRWALNMCERRRLREQVRGTNLTLKILARCEREGLSVFFYGSEQRTLDALTAALRARMPSLVLAGASPSRFCAVAGEELAEIGEAIAASGADVVFVGLGCPRQELFVHAMRESLRVPLIAVGAAFDYLAGTMPEPPQAFRRHGLEWLWRLWLEPRRLWRRYMLLNPAYIILVTLQAVRLWRPMTTTPLPEPPVRVPA